MTFIVGTEFLTRLATPYGGYMVAIMSLMESPAVIMEILLVRLFAPRGKGAPERPGVGHLLKQSFLNGTVYLLLGSLVVACDEAQLEPLLLTLRPLLSRFGGMCLVSEAVWVMH